MPALPIITDVFRCVLATTSGEASAANVLWFHSPGGDPTTLGADLVTSTLTATAGSSLQALISSAATFQHWDVTQLDGVTPTVRTSFGPGVHGGGATPVAAANVCGLISLATGLRGRSFRGRIYIPFIPQGLVDADGARLGTSWPTDVTGFFGQFLANMAGTTSSANLQVVSQKLGVSHLVTDWVGKRAIGSQRGRTERQEPL